MSDVVRLEGFNAPLKGQNTWVIAASNRIGPVLLNRFNQIEEECMGRGRKVLLVQNPRDVPMRWSQKVQWDAQFRIREAQDLRLAATYIQNSAKPVRVVWIGDEPPLSLLTLCSQSDVSFLGAGVSVPRMNYSAVFWDFSTPQQTIEEFLHAKMGSPYVQSLKIGSVLSELKASQVGFAWSVINESEKTGSVYWCDFDEEGKGSAITLQPSEAIEYMKEITSFLEHRF